MVTAVTNKENVQYGQVVNMTLVYCCNCGVPFSFPEDLRQAFHKDPEIWFFCPNGHRQHYSKSTEQVLRERIAGDKAAREKEEARLRDLALNAQTEAKNWQTQWERQMQDKKRIADKLKRTEKRIANGVCPCCNRTFQDLQRHMATQHPEVKNTPAEPEKRKRGRPRKIS